MSQVQQDFKRLIQTLCLSLSRITAGDDVMHSTVQTMNKTVVLALQTAPDLVMSKIVPVVLSMESEINDFTNIVKDPAAIARLVNVHLANIDKSEHAMNLVLMIVKACLDHADSNPEFIASTHETLLKLLIVSCQYGQGS